MVKVIGEIFNLYKEVLFEGLDILGVCLFQ